MVRIKEQLYTENHFLNVTASRYILDHNTIVISYERQSAAALINQL
jgi:hypothetical protein